MIDVLRMYTVFLYDVSRCGVSSTVWQINEDNNNYNNNNMILLSQIYP